MKQLKHFIKSDASSRNKKGRFRSRHEAEKVGFDLGLVAWKHDDGSWDLE